VLFGDARETDSGACRAGCVWRGVVQFTMASTPETRLLSSNPKEGRLTGRRMLIGDLCVIWLVVPSGCISRVVSSVWFRRREQRRLEIESLVAGKRRLGKYDKSACACGLIRELGIMLPGKGDRSLDQWMSSGCPARSARRRNRPMRSAIVGRTADARRRRYCRRRAETR